jgi:hypothetical protein
MNRSCVRLQVCAVRGKLQRIHVIVCTYSEAAETVEACVARLLAAPLPVYAERTVYVADDGHAKPEGPRKRAFVERMRAAGAPQAPPQQPANRLLCCGTDGGLCGKRDVLCRRKLK